MLAHRRDKETKERRAGQRELDKGHDNSMSFAPEHAVQSPCAPAHEPSDLTADYLIPLHLGFLVCDRGDDANMTDHLGQW